MRISERLLGSVKRLSRLRVSPTGAACWIAFIAILIVVPQVFPEDAVIRSGFDRLGPFAPFAYVLSEVLQVLIIPVPGQPFEISGGWLLGMWPGTLFGSLGALIGSILAFAIARRYGRGWVDRHVSGKVRDRFDAHFAREDRATWIVFLLMLVPIFPRDPLCYLAGLTGLGLGRFALIALIGRPIGLVPWVAAGAGGVEDGVKVQLAMGGVAAVVWVTHVVLSRARRAAPVLAPIVVPARMPGDDDA